LRHARPTKVNIARAKALLSRKKHVRAARATSPAHMSAYALHVQLFFCTCNFCFARGYCTCNLHVQLVVWRSARAGLHMQLFLHEQASLHKLLLHVQTLCCCTCKHCLLLFIFLVNETCSHTFFQDDTPRKICPFPKSTEQKR